MIPINFPPPIIANSDNIFFRTSNPALKDSLDPSCVLSHSVVSASAQNGKLSIKHNFKSYFPHPEHERADVYLINASPIKPLHERSRCLDTLNITLEVDQTPLNPGDVCETAFESFFVDAKISDSIHPGKHLVEATVATRVFQRVVRNSLDHDSQVVLGCLAGLSDGKCSEPVASAYRFFNLKIAEQRTSFNESFKLPASETNPVWILGNYHIKLSCDI